MRGYRGETLARILGLIICGGGGMALPVVFIADGAQESLGLGVWVHPSFFSEVQNVDGDVLASFYL
jgi:hypothetical protein